MLYSVPCFFCVFFFNDTATTEIYTLSLHDALPICIAAPMNMDCRAAPMTIGPKTFQIRPAERMTIMSATARPISNTRSVTGIPTARLITWWVIASEIVIFGGLLAAYIMHRLGHPEWASAASHTNTWAGAFNTFVLLTSSLCAVLAHKAADAHDGPRAARLLRLTSLGGLIFLT